MTGRWSTRPGLVSNACSPPRFKEPTTFIDCAKTKRSISRALLVGGVAPRIAGPVELLGRRKCVSRSSGAGASGARASGSEHRLGALGRCRNGGARRRSDSADAETNSAFSCCPDRRSESLARAADEPGASRRRSQSRLGEGDRRPSFDPAGAGGPRRSVAVGGQARGRRGHVGERTGGTSERPHPANRRDARRPSVASAGPGPRSIYRHAPTARRIRIRFTHGRRTAQHLGRHS